MRLPEWIKKNSRSDLHSTKRLLRRHRLTSVCEEARCPNQTECFAKPTAAFMILGSHCTRNCGFCSVKAEQPEPIKKNEPELIAHAAEEMGLKYVVITSVTRDDLPDGGAGHFAQCIRAVRKRSPQTKIEVLTPDFSGNSASLNTVLSEKPDVFNHNIETVERLYPLVRPLADYERSLHLLRNAAERSTDIYVKSGFMVGLGERYEEVIVLLEDLLGAGCDFLTIGQYLRPTMENLPVVEYVKPQVFEKLRLRALQMGFTFVVSGPLVRSSMNAEEIYQHV